jgi:hypothetical protein
MMLQCQPVQMQLSTLPLIKWSESSNTKSCEMSPQVYTDGEIYNFVNDWTLGRCLDESHFVTNGLPVCH